MEGEVFITSILSLFDLGVTIWLARSVTTLLANERFQKEYIIKEIDEIRSELKQLCIDIVEGTVSTRKIPAKYKDLFLWLKDVDTCIKEQTGFDNLSKVIRYLDSLRKWLTGLEEYNVCFSSELKLSPNNLTELEKQHRTISRELFIVAIEINKYRVEKYN